MFDLMLRQLEILYEGQACLAVLKPAGLATQSAPGIDSLEVLVRAFLDQRAVEEREQRVKYLTALHRLDRAVSGVVLMARTRRAARIISQQFERRQVQKIYWACVEGRVEPGENTWIDFMRKIPDQPRSEIVSADDAGAQRAVLHYRTVSFTPNGSLLKIELETGRMHQIRLQAASRGHPILGDVMYGSRIAFGQPAIDERERQIALHGREISFVLPLDHQRVSVVAPVPPSWSALNPPSA